MKFSKHLKKDIFKLKRPCSNILDVTCHRGPDHDTSYGQPIRKYLKDNIKELEMEQEYGICAET
jgi:hypothetical protein